MARFTVEIDVYSDLVCPWCYLGKEALDKAIATYTAQHPEADFKLNWKPYLLWPKVGVSAYERAAALQAVYGPSTPIVLERFAQFGKQYGIDFKWEGTSGNSRDAHKLVLLAMEKDAAAAAAASSSSSPSRISSTTLESSQPPEPTITSSTTKTTTNPFPNRNSTFSPSLQKSNNNSNPTNPHPHSQVPPAHTKTNQHRTLTALYTSAFQHGRDLSSPAFLAHTAVELGLLPTEADALAYFAQPEPTQQVDSSSALARVRVGVSAVPSYVVQGRWQVGGMQGEELWMSVFERVRAAVAAGSGNGSAHGGSDGAKQGVDGLTRVGRENGIGRGNSAENGEGRLRLELWVEEQRRAGRPGVVADGD